MLQSQFKLNNLIPPTHGGINHSELLNMGLVPDEILDFSSNCNPFGPPPGLKNAIKNAHIDIYPDSQSIELRKAISNKFHIDIDNVIVGNGSTELIRLIAQTYFCRGDRILISYPTYGEYEIASQLSGCLIERQKLPPRTHYRLPASMIISRINRNNIRAFFLCNPNNPTGEYLPRNIVEDIVNTNRNCLVILDEAYIAFTLNKWSSIEMLRNKNIILVRSMTKDYGLAGLRIGYAISNSEIIAGLNRIKPPWNVSSVAQKAALFALESDKYVDKCNEKLQKNKDFLIKELRSIGLEIVPSQANFFLVKVDNAFSIRQRLLNKGILVRDCTSFGLPEYIRIAPRKYKECQRLIDALSETGVMSNAC